MNPSIDTVPAPAPTSSSLRGHLLKGCLTVAILALIPHFGKSEDIEDGLRLGIYASTNSTGSNFNFGSIAAGYGNTLSGYYQYAFGTSNSITGMNSAAIGGTNYANASYSLAYGTTNQVLSTAGYSMSGGSYSIAKGQNSVAIGYFATAPSYTSVAFGRYNKVASGQSTSSWVASDQLFVIGNGTDSVPSNALEVKKDGTVIIPKRQGDISMGSFTAP